MESQATNDLRHVATQQILQQMEIGEVSDLEGLDDTLLEDGTWILLIPSKGFIASVGQPFGENGNEVVTRGYEFHYKTNGEQHEGILYLSDTPTALLFRVIPTGYSAFDRILIAERYHDGELHHAEDHDECATETLEAREFEGTRWVRWTEVARQFKLDPYEMILRYNCFLSGCAVLCGTEDPWVEDEWDDEENLVREGCEQTSGVEPWWCDLHHMGDSPEERCAFFGDIWIPTDEMELIRTLLRFGVTKPLPKTT